jgi:flagellar motor switch protein FliM
MAAAWRDIADIHPEHIGFEANPQLVATTGKKEPVIRIEISAEIEDFMGKLSFCIPFAMVEPLWDKLVSPVQCGEFEIDQRWTACLKEMLRETKVEVSVELGRVLLTCRELLDLSQGSVVGLNRPTSAELPIRIEGLPRLFGQPGCRKGNQAIQVTRTCEKGEIDE